MFGAIPNTSVSHYKEVIPSNFYSSTSLQVIPVSQATDVTDRRDVKAS